MKEFLRSGRSFVESVVPVLAYLENLGVVGDEMNQLYSDSRDQ
jgi:hypothetical protein